MIRILRGGDEREQELGKFADARNRVDIRFALGANTHDREHHGNEQGEEGI